MIYKSKKLHYYEYEENSKQRWGLTDDESYAKTIDPNYRLAILTDLEEWLCACDEIFQGVVEIKEGKYKWYEKHIYENGEWIDCDCGYIKVND